MESASSITVRPNEGSHRYELGGATGPERTFCHTTVDEGHGGQGLAAMLAHFALEDTIAAGAPGSADPGGQVTRSRETATLRALFKKGAPY